MRDDRVLSSHRTKSGNPVNSGIDRTSVCITLYQPGANSGSSRNSFWLCLGPMHILPMMSPENALKAWSRRMTFPVPASFSKRCSSLRATSPSIDWCFWIPIREKNGSRGFRRLRWRLWSSVRRWEPRTSCQRNARRRQRVRAPSKSIPLQNTS